VLEYQDPAPVLRVTTEATLVVQSSVAKVVLYPRYPAIGDALFITVVDDDLNLSPFLYDAVRVSLHTNGAENNSTYGLDLLESEASSGIFKGNVRLAAASSRPLNVSFSSSPSVSRTIYVSTGEEIVVTVNDLEPVAANRSANVAVATPVAVSLSNALAGGSLNIFVRDLDTLTENLMQRAGMTNIYHVDREPLNVSAAITWCCGGGNIALMEQIGPGLAIGTFMATVHLAGPLASIPGIDEVKEGMDITVTYSSAQVEGRKYSATTKIENSFSGFIHATSDKVETGFAIFVEVYDVDNNLDSSFIDSLKISVSVSGTNSEKNADRAKEVILLESGPSTSRFTGKILTLPEGSTLASSLAATAGLAEVTANESQTLVFTYSDSAPQRHVSTSVLLTENPRLELTLTAISDTQSLNHFERETERHIRQAGQLEIRAVDFLSNKSPLTLEQVVVLVTVFASGKDDASAASTQNSVVLEESGTNTGVFLATAQLVNRKASESPEPSQICGSCSSLTIVAEAGDVIEVSYGIAPNNRYARRTIFPSVVGIPSLRGDGDSELISYSSSSNLWMFQIGSILSLTVVDADLNQDSAELEQAIVSVAVSSGGQVAHVSLTEQSVDSPTFTGILRTGMVGPTGAELQQLLQQGVLPIAPGSVLTAIYQDAAPIKTIKSEVRARAAMTGILQFSPTLIKGGGMLILVSKNIF
jgi:hypothetical protein